MPKPAIVSANGSEASPRAMPKSACRRQSDHERPHADAADGAEQKHHGKPHPGIVGIDLAGRVSGFNIRGHVESRQLASRPSTNGCGRHGRAAHFSDAPR
jgi:hypothetical protein